MTLLELVAELVRVKKAADNKTPLLANQGQALDGYSELAMYRRIIEKIEEWNRAHD